jgi:E3 ubiquitin-protein ligase MARCH6
MARWWTFTARAFNLKGLLTDHARKPPITDSSHVLRVWQVIDVIAQIGLGRYDNAETWARVPASDSVVLLKPEVRQGRGVFVRLDNFGQAITPKGKLLMMQQDQAARDANRDPKVDYKVVWLPRYWRTRVHSVIFTALVLGGTVLALTVFAPLVVGRLILDRAMGEPVHDGYNWVCLSSMADVLADLSVDWSLRDLDTVLVRPES